MKKILIVDDSAFMRDILKDLLIESIPSIEVHEAYNKASAMEKMKKEKPNLVLLDVVMVDSELEGVDILREIKKTYPKTDVIMLSSVGQTAVVAECGDLGVEYYIQKPFDRFEVVEKINHYLK